MKYMDVTGKNEDEALSKALAKLGLERDDVSVEILERAKSGFLGLGSAPAKVRVRYGPEDEENEAPAAKPAPAQKPASKPAAPAAAPKPIMQTPAPKADAAPRANAAPKADAAPRANASSKPAPADGEEAPFVFVPVDNGEEVNDEKADAIRVFLKGLLAQMEMNAAVRVYQPEKGRYKVILEGESLGTLIGRRGETLDAVQQLTSYAVNRNGAGRVRIQLDAENYREKREQSLQHLALKVAEKVVKFRRSVTLEPMNAYERHVIHTALQEVPGVATYSTGSEPNRRVIVSYDREKQ